MMNGIKVLFRVDGSSRIGIGHVMRCLVLAEELKKHGAKCIFLTKNYDRVAIRIVKSFGFSVEIIPRNYRLNQDLAFTINCIKKYNPKIVVTDSYDLNSDYLTKIKSYLPDGVLLSIDDIARTRFYSDIVLNQNITANAKMYKGKIAPHTKLLLGTRYALLREEFRFKKQPKRKFAGEVSNILVTLGGGDWDKEAGKIINGMQEVKGNFIITVVLGAGFGNEHYRQLQRLAKKSEKRVILHRDVSNMSGLMAKADIAVTTGGSTSWEMAYLGLPHIILYVAPGNQKTVAERLDKEVVALNLGWAKKVSESRITAAVEKLIRNPSLRKKMSDKGKKLVDGKGAARVAEFLLQLN